MLEEYDPQHHHRHNQNNAEDNIQPPGNGFDGRRVNSGLRIAIGQAAEVRHFRFGGGAADEYQRCAAQYKQKHGKVQEVDLCQRGERSPADGGLAVHQLGDEHRAPSQESRCDSGGRCRFLYDHEETRS